MNYIKFTLPFYKKNVLRNTATAVRSIMCLAAELKAWDSMLCGSLVITTWLVLKLQMEKMASKHGEYL